VFFGRLFFGRLFFGRMFFGRMFFGGWSSHNRPLRIRNPHSSWLGRADSAVRTRLC
jgi:hypothetical protein